MKKPFFQNFRFPAFRRFLRFPSKKAVGLVLLAGYVFVLVSYLSVEWAASGRTYSDADEVPKNSVGVVLGTSSKLPDGTSNAYFALRMTAAAELYKKKRVDCLLVSGDNATANYNEIKTMQLALMEKGVPPERIYGDYAGFRTLDSMVRAKEVFGLSRFTVVSQESHAKRAVFLARLSGADAIAYEAVTPPFSAAALPILREIPARALAFYDAVLAGVGPKFLGDSVRIETDPSVRPVPDKVCFPR